MKELLITSSVLIIVLLILRAVFAKSVRRTLIYGTWLLVALRLLIPVQFGEMSISVLNLFQPVTQAVTDISNKPVIEAAPVAPPQALPEAQPDQPVQPVLPEIPEQSPITPDIQLPDNDPVPEPDMPQQEVPAPEVQPPAQEQAQTPEEKNPITVGQIAWSVWAIGAVLVAIWLSFSNLHFVRRMKKTATAVSADSPIPVYVTENAVSPCLVGLFRPAVYLTPEVAKDEQLRRYVLTHELTHYAHKDHIWSTVRCLCLCLYWFDPLVWVAAWCSRRDCELACDEGAMARLGEEERIAYGKALLTVVQEASVPSRLMLTATTMAETKRQLRRRVNFIARKPHLSLFAAIALVLVCSLVVGCVATGATPQTVAEDPIIESPAITEPTEATTPTETVSPTEMIVPTETTAPVDNTTAPATEPTKQTQLGTPIATATPAVTTTPWSASQPSATSAPSKSTTPTNSLSTTPTEETLENLVYGDLTYSVNSDGKTCTVQRGADRIREAVIPDAINGYKVTAIAAGAFSGCDLLSKAVLPQGLTAIPDRLFFGCDLLKTVVIPESVTSIGEMAFRGCARLTEITLPQGLTTIALGAFSYTGLQQMVIPQGVTVIEEQTFNSCRKLTEVEIPDGITEIKTRAFDSCVSLETIRLPKSLDSIGYNAFNFCSALKTIHYDGTTTQWNLVKKAYALPVGITIQCADGQLTATNPTKEPTIYTTAPSAMPGPAPSYYVPTLAPTGPATTTPTNPRFLADGIIYEQNSDGSTCTVVGCDKHLTNAVIPNTVNGYKVTAIGEKAFYYSSLQTVTFSNSLVSIGNAAFQNSLGLKKVSLPNSLTHLGDQAFDGCRYLEEVQLPSNLTTIGQRVFALTGLKTITIPEGVTTIMNSAFLGCDNLETVHFPNTLVLIGNDAFANCDLLKQINLPESLQEIGSAFFHCVALQELRIPEGVATLRNSLVFGCSQLKRVYIPSTITYIESLVFWDCPALETLHYDGTIAQWKAIGKDSSWTRKTVTVQCTDGQITDTYRR